MTEVGLVGPGRVGRALVALLPPDRFHVGPVVATSLTSARRSVREMQLGTPTDDVEAFASVAVILMAVPDDQLAGVVEQFSKSHFKFSKKVVLHTSAIQDSSRLAPLRARGAAVGSMSPLFVFQRPLFSLAGVHFAVEGDATAATIARRLIRSWDGEFQLVKPKDKIHNSVAVSIASDGLTGLVEAAVDQMAAGGFSRRRGLEAVSRVIQAALEDYRRSGRRSRPGPLLGGDQATVQRHLDALKRQDPRAAEGYRLVSKQTLLALGKGADGFAFLHED